MKGGVQNIWISIENIFPFLKLYATQWFSREKIKWLLQNKWNMSWEFQRNSNLKSILKLFSILELFEFYSNYFSPKIKYMEIRVKWFPTSENLREINLKSFWYFLKWFLLDFIKAVALFDLFKFMWILFDFTKMPML